MQQTLKELDRTRVRSRKDLVATVFKLAMEIDEKYEADRTAAGELVLVGVLNAAAYFTADLSRELLTANTIEFVRANSFEAENQRRAMGDVVVSNGSTTSLRSLGELVYNHDVLVCDTICDTGATMAAVVDVLREHGPKSLHTCALVWRKGVAPRPHFVGFEYDGPEFLYGYGLDDEGTKRSLYEIRAIAPAAADVTALA